jgi:hypothetical protein
MPTIKLLYNAGLMTASYLNSLEGEIQHIISYDFKGRLLEGNKEYKLHLPFEIPASEFWSIIVYDFLNRLIIQTDQSWPSVFSTNKKLVYNSDGSVDAWFGPKPVEGKENNWVKTIPGKKWYIILRLYYPLDSWFEKKWRPGEIEELNADDK